MSVCAIGRRWLDRFVRPQILARRPTREVRQRQQAGEARFEVLLKQWLLSEVPDRPRIRRPSGIIGFARRGDEIVVLRVPTNGHHKNKPLALAHFAGRGAVRLFDCDSDGAMVTECADPGTSLADLVLEGRDDEAMAALCEVASLLHSPDVPTNSFAPMEGAFERFLSSESPRIPSHLLTDARELLADLAMSRAEHFLLHGDLHHENILFDKCRGWLAIDPSPVIGERAFDLAAAFRNPSDQPPWIVTSRVADRRSRIASERLGLDRHRLLAWVFVESVRLAVWSLDNNLAPDWSLATAYAVRRHL